MQARIGKWGNSLAFRIPAVMASELNVNENSTVDVSVVDGQLVIKPAVCNKKYSLSELLKGVNKDNIHEEILTGPAKGREIW